MSYRTVHRLFCDPDKEERWLNEMAAKGLNLAGYTWCTYRFEQGAAGEWIYRIQLLEHGAQKPAGREYLAFLDETGIQTVCMYMNWVYLRRSAAMGPFELFSDLCSLIAYHRRRLAFCWLMIITQAPLAALLASSLSRGSFSPALGLPILLIQLTALAVFSVLGFRLARRLQALERQKKVFD